MINTFAERRSEVALSEDEHPVEKLGQEGQQRELLVRDETNGRDSKGASLGPALRQVTRLIKF